MEKLTITTFTDPMMGLSYECEPIFRKLETHFPNITFQYVMSVLVPDVYDRVNPDDLLHSKEFALKNYNQQLAKIYESEEAITGMPINMTDFHLFSTEHTSSLPLNLAYKAAQLAASEKADLFLYNLRYATIVDCRPTTQLPEILKVVQQTNIDENSFLKHYHDGSGQEALNRDLAFRQELGIRDLPAYLIHYQEKSVLVQRLIGYDTFVSVIAQLTNGQVKPQVVSASLDPLRRLLKAHPLISPIEIQYAFDLENIEQVQTFIQPLIDNQEIVTKEVHHGWFIERQDLDAGQEQVRGLLCWGEK